MPAQVGDIHNCKIRKTLVAKGIRIERRVVRLAYARNGNTDNPTPEYRWTVYHNDRNSGGADRFKGAVELAEML